MSIPLIVTTPVFTDAVASSTASLFTINYEFQKCVSIVYEVATTGFTGTLDFQSSIPPTSTQRNVAWVELDDEGSPHTAPSNDTVAFNGETANHRYLVPISGIQPRVVMTRSGGTITVAAVGYGVYIPPNAASGLYSAPDSDVPPGTEPSLDPAADQLSIYTVLVLLESHLRAIRSGQEAVWVELSKHSDALSEIVERDLQPGNLPR